MLMNKFPMIQIEALHKKPIEEQAENAAYRSPTGELIIPGNNIQRALVSAATFSKGKGRASLQKEVAASLMVEEAECDLNQKKYTIDTRPVVINKARVLKHRPRLDTWKTSFTISYDEVLMTGTQVRKIVDDCGSRVGLLDFRPERKGPFGRFMVVEWQ